MAHVILSADLSSITGIFANAQPGISIEVSDDDPRIAAFLTAQDVYFVPAPLVRSRLQAAGLWDAAAAALAAAPANLLWFATLEEGILPGDPTATALLTAIGADPSAILARP